PRIRRAFQLALRRRDLTEREIDEELRTHLAFRISQLMARVLPREEAERVAYQRLGGSWEDAVDRVQRSGRTRDDHLQLRERLNAARADLAYAMRPLVRPRHGRDGDDVPRDRPSAAPAAASGWPAG